MISHPTAWAKTTASNVERDRTFFFQFETVVSDRSTRRAISARDIPLRYAARKSSRMMGSAVLIAFRPLGSWFLSRYRFASRAFSRASFSAFGSSPISAHPLNVEPEHREGKYIEAAFRAIVVGADPTIVPSEDRFNPHRLRPPALRVLRRTCHERTVAPLSSPALRRSFWCP